MSAHYGRWLGNIMQVGPFAFLIAAPNYAAAQQTPQKPPFQILIEQQIGQQAVEMAILKSNIEQLQGIIAERDRTIAKLQADLAAKKPAEEAPK